MVIHRASGPTEDAIDRAGALDRSTAPARIAVACTTAPTAATGAP